MNRIFAPGFIVFLLFGTGTYFGLRFDFTYECPLIILAFSIIAGLLLNRKNELLSNFFLALSVLLAGGVWAKLRTGYFPKDHIINYASIDKHHNVVKGLVLEQWGSKSYICKACSLRTEKGFIGVKGNFLLVLPRVGFEDFGDDSSFTACEFDDPGRLEYGDIILLRGIFETIRSPSNFYVYDPATRLAEKGVRLQVRMDEDDSLTIIGTGRGNRLMYHIIVPLRNRIKFAIEQNFSGIYRGLLKGIILGEKAGIPYETRLEFSRSGISHILAVSGLHMGIIVGVIFLLFGVIFGGNYKMAVFPSIVCAFIYVLLVGAQPSSVRAGIMTSCFLISLYGGKSYSSFHGLGLAGFVILLLNPLELANPGFQLSFGAVWGILVLYPILNGAFKRFFDRTLQKAQRFASPVYSLFSVSTAAQFGTSALVALIFFRLQLIGPLVNMIVVPALSLALPTGLLAIIFFYIYLPLSHIFSAATYFYLYIVLKTAHIAGNWGYSAPFVQAPQAGFIAGYYLALSLLADIILKTKTSGISKIILAGLITLFVSYEAYTHLKQKPVELVMFDTYQGSAFAISDGKDIIAIGNCSRFDWKRNVVPYINAKGKENARSVLDIGVPGYENKKCLTFGGFEITINKYGWVKMWSPFYTLYLVPQKDKRYFMRIESNQKEMPLRLNIFPRMIAQDEPGINLDMRSTGAVIVRFYDDKLELESKRLGRFVEWRTRGNNGRII